MSIQNYRKAIYYLKASGICVAVTCGSWLLYQIRQTKLLFSSVVPLNILELEPPKAQYIYINDPRFKDNFVFNNPDDHELSPTEEPKNLSSMITKWWRSIHHDLALRLLQLARNGNRAERRRAVDTLSSLKLQAWHYCQIAQMLDARTAVALARSPDADLRFFLKPPHFYLQYRLNDIVEKIHELLLKLNALCGACHPCLVQFLHKKFQGPHRDTSIFEHDLISTEPHLIAWDFDFLLNCIQTIHHHSSLEEHSKEVADAGGLQLLMEVHKLVGDDIEICSSIAKILSNLSLHPEHLQDIFRSGWIGVLASWSRHGDIRLASPASRALANLDSDDLENERYFQRIYPLYPLHRVNFRKKLDVIFIHGLLGGVFVTWRQRDIDNSIPVPDNKNNDNKLSLRSIVDDHPSEFIKDLARDLEVHEWQKIGHDFKVVLHDCPENMKYENSGPFFCNGDDQCMQQSEIDCKEQSLCWPKDWIPKDVPNVRIIGINYTSNLSMWSPLCPLEGVRSTIRDRSNEFTRKLITAGVGKRSIIWACHSMGGLLVKKMLVEEWKSGDKNNLLRNTKGIIFYSVPHRGSHIAALNQTTQMLVWPSIEVQELREQSQQLLKLHEDFLSMLKEHDIEIISFGETKPTRFTAFKVPFRIVNSSSADPDVGEFFEIPQDHITICKPANRQSFLYQKVLAMIKRHSRSTDTNKYSWEKFIFLPDKFL